MDQFDPMVAGTAGSHQRRIPPVTEDGSPTEGELREHYRDLL
jgi:hypothetical protein